MSPNSPILYAGYDPGYDGALVFLREDGAFHSLYEPLADLDPAGWKRFWGFRLVYGETVFRGLGTPVFEVVVEEHMIRFAKKSQGVSAQNHGRACQWLLDRPGVQELSIVPAREWKGYFGLTAKKQGSLDEAAKRWPKEEDILCKRHDRAEAALMAEWLRLGKTGERVSPSPGISTPGSPE